MFDVPPKCPALANKLSGLFGWRHTYKVAAKHEGIPHGTLHKSYSLTLPKRPPSPSYTCVKEAGSWVAVHHLQTQSGILDPDDYVRDVADDREQILAHFEDSGPDPGVPQGGGDGASGSSSVGTGSPDIFRDPTNTEAPTRDLSTPHIEVTSTTSGPLAGLGVGLMVRRSSDPNLLASLKAEGSNKRWSAAAPHYAGGDSPERLLLDKAGGQLSPQWEEEDDAAAQLKEQLQQQQQLPAHAGAGAGGSHQPFARSGRLSMQFLGDGNGYKWMEAAEKLQHQQQPPALPTSLPNSAYSSKSLPRESKRKEPLGQAYESIREKDGEMLLIINEYGSPLGLTAMPDKEHGGGLLVQHVEPGSRAERGRLRREDRILEINGIKLIGLSESQVQEQLRRALESSELRVRVLRGDQQRRQQQRQQQQQQRDSKVAEMVEVVTVSPTRKPHAAPVGTSLQVANTRKLGRKIEILLKKGPNGLGFSVTTRDNPAGGHCPIYIKNILPRGAAIEDGRLKPGDRLLEVDGTPMTGKTQTDVVAILRGMPAGATVRIVVSRQQELAEVAVGAEPMEKVVAPAASPAQAPAPAVTSAPIPVQKSSSARSLFQQHQQQAQLNESQHFIDAGSESAASNDSLPPSSSSWHSREELTLHIPVHDTEKAGLGVSVKGKTCSNLNSSTTSGNSNSMKHDGDLGIFVKNVIHGGAASRDGRLRMNDQLLSVNGVSLRGQNNAEAMETLRRAMVNNPGKHPGTITLLVGRKILRSASSSDILEHSHSQHNHSHSNSNSSGSGSNNSNNSNSHNNNINSNGNGNNNNSSSNASDNSGATVIYLSPEKREPRGSGNGPGSAGSDMNRWSNPVLDRLTGGICSSNSAQSSQSQQQQQSQPSQSQGQSQQRRLPPPPLGVNNAGLRNESYYMATNDNWSPAQLHLLNGHGNTALLIEDDAEPMSPTLPVRGHDGQHCNASSANISQASAGMGQVGVATPPVGSGNFDATYSSQLSLETNNSGVEHFSRDALGRRSISEKHHAALDARETGTYQRNKKLREERERERRIQLTKSAVYGGSIESLTARIASANAQMAAAAAGYKHAKTSSHIEQREQQQQQLLAAEAEARDQLGDLGPSLGLKKSSSLESLQTMVQELQMSDEPRAHHALRAPRGRGREDSLRAAVVSEPDANKPRKTWLLEEGDHEGGFASQRNGPFQSSLNDGKHGSKSRAKKPSILRGIGHMFRFGKNRKDGVVPVDSYATSSVVSSTQASTTAQQQQQQHQQQQQQLQHQQQQQQIPAAALAALDRNGKPPAYQPPPPLPAPNATGVGGGVGTAGQQLNGGGGAAAGGVGGGGGGTLNGGIHQNDIFNHRYQHYANYEDLHQHQISDEEGGQETLSESTLECMRQQVIRQRIKVEAESRRHQHYHSQRSARSQDVSMHSSSSQQQQQPPLPLPPSAAAVAAAQQNGGLRPVSSYYEYDTVQQQRVGSIKHSHGHNHNHSHNHNHAHSHGHTLGHGLHNGNNNNASSSPISVSVAAQPHWKAATMNGFSPASLNSSARSRGPFVTQVTIREQTGGMPQQQQQQPTYQTVQKAQSQYGSSAAGAQPHASKV